MSHIIIFSEEYVQQVERDCKLLFYFCILLQNLNLLELQ